MNTMSLEGNLKIESVNSDKSDQYEEMMVNDGYVLFKNIISLELLYTLINAKTMRPN